MKYEEFAPSTRKAIDDFASKRGISKETVVRRFEQLFHGGRVSKHLERAKVFA